VEGFEIKDVKVILQGRRIVVEEFERGECVGDIKG
jgi:hypothetical protein